MKVGLTVYAILSQYTHYSLNWIQKFALTQIYSFVASSIAEIFKICKSIHFIWRSVLCSHLWYSNMDINNKNYFTCIVKLNDYMTIWKIIQHYGGILLHLCQNKGKQRYFDVLSMWGITSIVQWTYLRKIIFHHKTSNEKTGIGPNIFPFTIMITLLQSWCKGD